MHLNLAFLFVFYWLSIFSCLGYGVLISKLTKKKFYFRNYGYLGLLGILFLIIYAYLSNIFYAHSLLHNLIIILTGILLFVYFVFSNFFQRNRILNLSIIFFLLFISFIIYKPHDDFSYYHFQYSYYLTQFPMIIGAGQLNHGFSTSSSIFYLNSLFFLPFAKYSLFHISAILVFGFSNVVILEKLFRYLKKNSPNYLSFFLLLTLAFINIIFYRIAEHGTDRSAQILIFLLVFELILLINDRKNFDNSLNKIFILLSLIISFKAFYILYFLFLFPVFIYGYKKFKFDLFFLIIKNNFFWYLVTTFFIIILTNFFNSGCFLYPVKFTCFENFAWAFSLDHVSHMNNWYEQWSKAGAGPNFRVENPQEYILYFNWITNWIDQYFFNKVSDFLFGLITIILIFYLFFCSTSSKKIISKEKIFSIYICILILFFEWLYNHPTLRYGGYVLIGLIFFIPFSLILEKFSKDNLNYKFKIIIVLIFITFISRNIDRLDNEIEKYSYKPFENSHYRFDENYFKIDQVIKSLINNHSLCNKFGKCDENSTIKTGSILGKLYLINKK